MRGGFVVSPVSRPVDNKEGVGDTSRAAGYRRLNTNLRPCLLTTLHCGAGGEDSVPDDSDSPSVSNDGVGDASGAA